MIEINKLHNSSLKALKEYMGLKPEETLLIVTDKTKREISQSLLMSGQKLCREAFLIEMKSRETNGQEPPKQIAELMKVVDVVLCPTEKSLTHTNARREASNLGVRVGTMPGISVDTMIRCLNADADKIIELTRSLANKLSATSEIRIKTKKGTDITLPMKDRLILESTGVLKEKGNSGNLPSGEVYLAPLEGKSNGIIIADGSVAGIGILNIPITIVVKNGYAEEIKGGEQANILKSMLDKSGPDAFAVAEFGMGTNYKAQLCGEILEDEKVFGTIHIAFGNNISMGGTISVSCHIDVLIKEPDVYFDEKLIMKKGKLIKNL